MNFVKLIQLFPTIPVAAMTSILHHSSRKSFIELMHRPRMTVTVGEVDQPNLFYSAFFFEEIKHAEYAVAQLLIKHLDNGKVVLYATLKKDVDKYYEMVMKLVEKQRRRGGNTMVVRRYHAGLNAREQEESIKLWNTGAVDVICATSAFAFAFTRKDVALILHTSLPLNVESFLLVSDT